MYKHPSNTMPEGHFVVNDSLVMSESPLDLEDDCFLPSTAAGLETSKGKLAKAESISSLPDIPDIFIPLPLFNPLPLQCLAANALPDELKSEIDGVIALYSADSAESTAGGPCNDTDRDASPEDDGSLASSGEPAAVTEGNYSAVSDTDAPVKRILLQRDPLTRELANDLGIGAYITGGLKCDGCGRLHTVVTAITGACPSDLHEGLCVVEWCGSVLEGATHEEVRRILAATNHQEEIEFVVKECSKLKWPQRGFWASRFATLRANMRRSPRSKDKKTKHSHATSGDTPSIDHLHVTQATSSVHVTSTNDHVTPTNDHVTLGSDHVTPTNDHVTLGSDHVTGSPSKTLAVHAPSPSPSPITSPTPSTLLPPMFSRRRPRHSRSSSSTKLPTTPEESTRPPSISLSVPEAGEGSLRSPNISATSDLSASLPNGIVQLSLDYRREEEILEMILHQVKDQFSSKEMGKPTDLFMNTYLIPDLRGQGVRSCRMASRNPAVEKPPSYTVKEDEVASVALRVIVWEASNGKNSIFRGEVLLDLSDGDIVDLRGTPVWYTISSADPNLPRLPKPVHYKQKQKLEHLLGQALSYLKQHTFKLSSAQQQETEPQASASSSSLPEKENLSSPVKRRSPSLSSRKQRKQTGKMRQRFGTLSKVPKMLDALSQAAQSELDEIPTSQKNSDNSRFARLSTIVQVLRDVKTSDPAAANPSHDAPSDKRQTRLLSILQVLQDSTTDIPPPEAQQTGGFLQPLFDEEDNSFSTLDRRKRERPMSTPLLEEIEEKAKERKETLVNSQSFPVMPGKLRESLHGYRRRVTVYAFQEENTNKEGEIAELAELESSLDTDDHSQEGTRTDKNTVESHPLIKLHYKVLDERGGEDEVDSVAAETEIGAEENTTTPFSSTSPSQGMLPPGESVQPTLLTLDGRRRMPRRRSLSVGDMKNLDSDDELESPLAPFQTLASHSAEHGGMSSLIDISNFRPATLVPVIEEGSSNGDISSSPDIELRTSFHQEGSLSRSERTQQRSEEMLSSVEGAQGVEKRRVSLTKWKSFDDLLDSLPIGKLKPRRRRSGSQNNLAPPKPQLKTASIPTHGHKSSGSVKLQLEFSAHSNPSMLTVKLVDIVLMSSKAMSLDYTLKGHLYHKGTGVCLLRKKTTIKMKNAERKGAPLGELHFDTDIFGLSLQVSLIRGGKLFPKRSVGHILMDLDSLNLMQRHTHTEWFQLSRDT